VLELKLQKRYPGFALEVSLALPEGETAALLGPSGSGKSTLLKLIAGLLPPDGGWVRLGGVDLTPLPPERRGVGFVFQDYALFPHLTVWDNVAFGLVEARWPREALRARVEELLERTGLRAHAHKKPQALSGGEQQRVALARALAKRPRLLLLDEPLGALDLRLKEELLFFLRRLLKEERTTALVVTHDQEEAFLLAQKVVVMREGKVVQMGRPEAVWTRPQDAWVARFLGHKNLLSPEESARLGLPPRAHLLLPGALDLGAGEEGVVEERLFFGARVGLWLSWRGVRLYWEGAEPGLEEGDRVGVRLDPALALPLD
jgi:putative spermidine/putrescine transport system ATP-binding protein